MLWHELMLRGLQDVYYDYIGAVLHILLSEGPLSIELLRNTSTFVSFPGVRHLGIFEKMALFLPKQ